MTVALFLSRTVWAVLVLAVAGAAFAGESAPWPVPDWPKAEPADVGMDAAKLDAARKYALTGGGSGLIVRHGRVVLHWGDLKRRYGLKSTTKSIGVTALGLALKDGKIKSLDDRARLYHPSLGVPPKENAETGWLDKITVFHLATQTAGFDKRGGYTKLLFEPGTKWRYSDGGPNWLAECITLQYGKDLRDVLFKRVFSPLGIKASDLTWRKNAYRKAKIDGIVRREFGSGVSANVNAMARIGYLYLRRGRWREQQILTASFVDACRTTPKRIRGVPVVDPKRYGKASDHYGLLWWNNADGTLEVPRDAYWSWGLYDSLIVVMPSLDVVVARAGKSFRRGRGAHYDVLRGFLEPIAASVKAEPKPTPAPPADRAGQPPCPPSPVIRAVRWAPRNTVLRLAKGSDNWPITWADDDALYTAYGDGWGFRPRVEKKLSLGLAKVLGVPPKVRGVNIRSPTGEQTGGGSRGRKASGLLMVGGVLYMWVRNADGRGHSSQLAWSRDHARTWTWCEWRFEKSFGYPTFVNFSRNYAGARDEYVYTVSHDSASAYAPADRMVLARAPKEKLTDRRGYEFFERLDDAGKPVWTSSIARRGGVFRHRGRCYRSGISYNAALKRYLWCQLMGRDARFKGGLGVYDAPQPWGPWTTAFFTEKWDVGPGETASMPPKWMSADGRTVHMVFSGDDCFSVRKAAIVLAERTIRSESE